MDKKQIILIGGGGHCRSCIDVVEGTDLYNIAGILDLEANLETRILGYKIIGTDRDIPGLAGEGFSFLITIGQIASPAKRIELFELLKELKADLPVIVSPYAYVSKHSKVGIGTIIMNSAVINAGAEVGENCIINSRALIEHDARVGNNCHISTGAIINGGAEIGESTFFGSGAISVQNAVIPPDSFIKANSLFIRS